MFKKILIANRGEIACRVITTARRLGIATVAVYSDADARAKHVAMADEALRIGPPPVAESYLSGEAIIAAARRSGAEAIHPGYGFLSENPDFVAAVAAAGLVFIGPPAEAIRAMGLKDAAKALMEKAGVPVVPGYHGAEQDPVLLAAEADRIGYPVLIKARAGGGGKGMRRVDEPARFAEALAGARREAQASFGDPTCLVEKYVNGPRHIEIQVFADAHGQVVHLFERDCSLQRRHQKVIEEAPAPGMPAAVREAMGRAAVEAARAIDYQGAGTVEFIADGSRGLRTDGFWFMEMNTRLQVEHPVTEAITGLDLVEWQLRVAAGERLPWTQADLAIHGHACEARIYAEDVARGFLPATGRLDHLGMPAAAEFVRAPVRIDAGVRQGDEITPHYDPMIAKLIVHAPDRPAALARLAGALDRFHVAGSITNVAFLAALARHESFLAGELDTGLIARDLAALVAVTAPPREAIALAAISALELHRQPVSEDPFDRLIGWRAWARSAYHVLLHTEDGPLDCRVSPLGQGRFMVAGAIEIDLVLEPGDSADSCWLVADDHRQLARVALTPELVTVFWGGRAHGFTRPDPLRLEDEGDAAADTVSAPMPGLVKLVAVGAGQAVERGAALLVLEAMKMEHTLTAPRDGVIAEMLTAEGEQVSEGAILLRLAAEDG